MGYHPETLVYSFPPHPRTRAKLGAKEPWSLVGALYALKPWIGFDIWHIDPERVVPGRRQDDSCGWFPRDLTPELERAVNELCGGGWADLRQRISDAFDLWYIPNEKYPTLREMPMHVAYSTHLMTLMWIDRLAFKRGRRNEPTARLVRLASWLAFSTVDNLNLVADQTPERYIRQLAAAYRREIRPWWKHPRWHIHHWKVSFDLARNLRRMFERCATCRKPLGFGYCPTHDGRGLHHGQCLGMFAASNLKDHP